MKHCWSRRPLGPRPAGSQDARLIFGGATGSIHRPRPDRPPLMTPSSRSRDEPRALDPFAARRQARIGLARGLLTAHYVNTAGGGLPPTHHAHSHPAPRAPGATRRRRVRTPHQEEAAAHRIVAKLNRPGWIRRMRRVPARCSRRSHRSRAPSRGPAAIDPIGATRTPTATLPDRLVIPRTRRLRSCPDLRQGCRRCAEARPIAIPASTRIRTARRATVYDAALCRCRLQRARPR